MIKVFKSPLNTRCLSSLLDNLRFNGRVVLSIKQHGVDDFWLVKTADRKWFEALPNDKQLRVVLGRRLNDG
jgi:hypothetical protein